MHTEMGTRRSPRTFRTLRRRGVHVVEPGVGRRLAAMGLAGWLIR
jgi:hypothetical protein